MDKLFYRVGIESGQGLWYNNIGEFTGNIHKNEYTSIITNKIKLI